MPAGPERPPLLLHLGSSADPHRLPLALSLAVLARRAGWRFDAYADAPRTGRHFGSGDPRAAPPGAGNGSLVVGGAHAEQLARLAAHGRLLVAGDPGSILWAAAADAGAELLAGSTDPTEVLGAVQQLLEVDVPTTAAVVDGAPPGPDALVLAPFVAPLILAREWLAVDVTAPPATLANLEGLGVARFVGLYVHRDRLEAFPLPVAEHEGAVTGDYAEVTAGIADKTTGWARGVFLGDPDLVAAQVPRIARLQLVALHGRPQVEAVRLAATVVRDAEEPVWGRQWDDRDFFELARLGHGFQLVDPDPPFDALAGLPRSPMQVPCCEPDDRQLEQWAHDGRVLSTLVLWCGMVREVDTLGRFIDALAVTGARAGLLVTLPNLELVGLSTLAALTALPERGGVGGAVDILLSSTGRGVAAEYLLAGRLEELLTASRDAAAAFVGVPALHGWWPLMDAPLEPSAPTRIERSGWHPVLTYASRGDGAAPPATASAGVAGAGAPASARRRDLRGLVGDVVRGSALRHLVRERRPYEDQRPGALDPRITEAVAAAGFSYHWTKAGFGECRVVHRHGDVVAVPFTAGNWDGWSPFYTVGSVDDLDRAERRLLRSGAPGWLASTIDGPLWGMSGEVWDRGGELVRVLRRLAEGGRSGRLVNVTPNVVARYARLLDDRR